jgi:hypothetical protein
MLWVSSYKSDFLSEVGERLEKSVFKADQTQVWTKGPRQILDLVLSREMFWTLKLKDLLDPAYCDKISKIHG